MHDRHTGARGTWNAQSVLEALRDWARETGAPPRSIDFCPSTQRSLGRGGPEKTLWEREHPRWPSSTTVYRFYDSWPEALAQAGLSAAAPVAARRDLPARVAAARRLAHAGLTMEQIGEEIGVSAQTASRYLRAHPCPGCEAGVIVGDGDRCTRCAVRAANPRRWTKAELVALVKEWAAEHDGQPPRTQDWMPSADPDRPSRWTLELPRWPPASAGRIVFGSWANLLLAAGFPIYNASWTREQVLDALRAWAQEHGKAPPKQAWDTTDGSHPSSATVRRMFGSFTEAVRQAGLDPGRELWTPERITAAIVAFTEQHGRPPTPAEWHESSPDHPCRSTVRNRFGSWAAALASANA
ncbi:hypothetical protein GKE82_24350 [Conexibacter sp. W3-3-2]|uniref:homing endonuclease associated repeat-containing protein n=1 Tax=Conexibacter sp. W3-3-2 TaxID=2675227 RepID=UPI0012B94A1B|nr:hypothetical protein [Conexibacter sp. W3-3-2]MTD47341.1 hypothetical protein [Conexibacter sp. W3-3-2]